MRRNVVASDIARGERGHNTTVYPGGVDRGSGMRWRRLDQQRLSSVGLQPPVQ
jgi:hypothetical protein